MKKDTGFVRIAAAVPGTKVADPAENAEEIIKLTEDAEAEKAGIVVFPELALTGYTCGDLFFQDTLYDAQIRALGDIVNSTLRKRVTVVVGMYVRSEGALIDSVAVIRKGKLAGIVPKTYLTPGERRWFAPGGSWDVIDLPGSSDQFEASCVPFGPQIFHDEVSGLSFGIEIGSDMNSPVPPSAALTLRGAQVILNCAAQPDGMRAPMQRAESVKALSARLGCAYVYCGAGSSESNTDLMFSGQTVFAEAGEILHEGKRFSAGNNIEFCEADFRSIDFIRAHDTSRAGCRESIRGIDEIYFTDIEPVRPVNDGEKLFRTYERSPFVPDDPAEADAVCEEVFSIQTNALAKRMKSAHCTKLVVGISGGLDSTLTLLACSQAQRIANHPAGSTITVTMPGFGTTDQTYQHALDMMRLLGTDMREVSIVKSVTQHFEDIGQDSDNHDVTYENAQARERTQILMDIANQENALVIGTGDLSEIALGWCTYNGDHMSMYGVNGTVPKTMMRRIISWIIRDKLTGENADPKFSKDNGKLAETLQAVLDTPVSPELLPPDLSGEILQKTEDRVGPYELHDFFIYYTVMHGMGPAKLFMICRSAWGEEYDDETIKKWLKNFYRRFFTQQFKRDCSPGGAQVGPVSLSPRGGWQVPSEAQVTQWLRELDF
ncbi:MAG: NAD(+) synthase [Anaerovoracaceae bacterium]|nr:NAD(+) synthase [Anaerovoracaceae bacterium]